MHMTEKRELEGIGYHHFDYDGDCLLVERWAKRPEDLKGQSLTIGKLLPREIRCTAINHPNEGYIRKFRFRITIEVDNIGVNK
jgi:hypothetical protein